MEDTLNDVCCNELSSSVMLISSNYSPDDMNLLRLYSIQTLKYPLTIWKIIHKSTDSTKGYLWLRWNCFLCIVEKMEKLKSAVTILMIARHKW